MKSFEVLRNGSHYAGFNNLVTMTCCTKLFLPLEEGEYTCADCGTKFEIRERPVDDIPQSGYTYVVT